jgi:hypothetical protein
MTYYLSLFINFLAVFILTRYAPGIASTYSQTSPLGSDLLFAAALGFFNASVFPFLIIVDILPTKLRLAILTGILSFGGFTLISIIPYGFQPDVGGVVLGGALTWLVAFLTNYFRMLRWVEENKKYLTKNL